MAPKRGLGKGLSALLPQNQPSQNEPGPEGYGAGRFIPLDRLTANPDQPRKHFNDEELTELADSIREHGVIQPIIVEETGDGNYRIVAGERRSRAAKIAGLEEIPAIIRAYSDEKRMIVSLIENVQRADLDPIEEAAAYKRLMELTGLSQDETAVKVGKNRSTVANALRLLKLPEEMQKSIGEGTVSPGHARALLSVTDKRAREKLYREILERNISVREAEKQAAGLNTGPGENKDKKVPPKRPPEIGAMEEKFIKHLGTKVVIEGSLNRGRILIDYFSMEDLERLYEILGN